MTRFISNLAKNDKKTYDQLVSLVQLCNKNDIDMRQLGQLRAPFHTKEGKEPLQTIPMSNFRDCLQANLRHFRNSDDIVNTFIALTLVVGDDSQQQLVGYQKLTTALEFIKCYPLITKKDKNTSNGVGFVMNQAAQLNQQVSIQTRFKIIFS